MEGLIDIRPAVFGWAHALWLCHLSNLQQ